MSVEDKLDLILSQIDSIQQQIQQFHGLDVRESLEEIYESVDRAQKSLKLPDIERITNYLFDTVQKTSSRGIYLSTSLTQISPTQQLWFLNANYIENLHEIAIDEVLEKKLSATGSSLRIRILDILSKQSLGFGAINEHMRLLDGALNHHLKLLLEVKFIDKRDKEYHLTSQGLQVLWFAKSLAMEPSEENPDGEHPSV